MNRARRRPAWTFSADNPTARARTIARGCWHALAKVDPEQARQIAALAALHGEVAWLTPTLATHEPDEPLTREQVAHIAAVDQPAVVMWGKRGIRRKGETHYLRPDDLGRYDHTAVMEFLRLRDSPDTRAPRKAPPCPTRHPSSRQHAARPASTSHASTP